MLNKKTIDYLNKIKQKNISNKTFLITGATSGIGLKTLEIAVSLGARVIMAIRNLEKGYHVKDTIINEYPNARIELIKLDISSFQSIKSFVEELKEKKVDIDYFINNAGIFCHPNEVTKDSFEAVIGTNYYGLYYLNSLVLPYLKTLSHEVILFNTSSLAHRFGHLDYRDFYGKKKYKNFKIYARSKLATCMLSYQEIIDYKNTNVKIYMIHPGIAPTTIVRHGLGDLIYQLEVLFRFLFNSVEKSSLACFYCIFKEPKNDVMIGPSLLFDGWGKPKENRVSRAFKKYVYNDTKRKELILYTEKEIKEAILKL